MFDWLMDYSSILRATILASIIIGLIIVITLGLYLFKPKIKKENFKYFYAFSAGFVMIVGALGLFPAARHGLTEHFGKEHIENGEVHMELGTKEIFIVIGFVLGIIALCGLMIYITKTAFITNAKDKDKEYKRRKTMGIVMVLLHRLPASFVIGALANEVNEEPAALFAIILHIIPDLLIVFYRQIEMGVSKNKALINSILVKLVFLPFILLGNVLAQWAEETWWFMPMLSIMGGTFLVYASFAELTPEFAELLNIEHTHEHLEDIVSDGHTQHTITLKKRKEISLITVSLFIGIASAVAIMFIHSH